MVEQPRSNDLFLSGLGKQYSMTNTSNQASETVSDFMGRQGLGDKVCQRNWFKDGAVIVDGIVASETTPLSLDSSLSIRGVDYQIKATQEAGRTTLKCHYPERVTPIKGRIRVQCGYHKCLTMYFRRVSKKIAMWNNPFNGEFRHFFHRLDEFHQDSSQYSISSVSGHCLDLDQFEDIRAVHIIRDPRDMIISGYFYHKRAGEPWCNYINPTDDDWSVVNARVPSALPADTSFADYLNNVSIEEGLAAEIEFRRNHFESMMKWPTDDPRVLTVKYEEILGNESDTFKKIYDFYGFPFHTKMAAMVYAGRYSAKSARRLSTHIRNPSGGQWKELFTPDLKHRFDEQYGGLLEKYGYQHE